MQGIDPGTSSNNMSPDCTYVPEPFSIVMLSELKFRPGCLLLIWTLLGWIVTGYWDYNNINLQIIIYSSEAWKALWNLPILFSRSLCHFKAQRTKQGPLFNIVKERSHDNAFKWTHTRIPPLWNVNLESSLTMVKHGQNMVVYVVRSDFDSGRL